MRETGLPTYKFMNVPLSKMRGSLPFAMRRLVRIVLRQRQGVYASYIIHSTFGSPRQAASCPKRWCMLCHGILVPPTMFNQRKETRHKRCQEIWRCSSASRGLWRFVFLKTCGKMPHTCRWSSRHLCIIYSLELSDPITILYLYARHFWCQNYARAVA